MFLNSRCIRIKLMYSETDGFAIWMKRLKDFLDGSIAQGVLPAGNLGKAFNYLRSHWKELTVYTKDGWLPIDRHHVERFMKRMVIGRKTDCV